MNLTCRSDSSLSPGLPEPSTFAWTTDRKARLGDLARGLRQRAAAIEATLTIVWALAPLVVAIAMLAMVAA
jgi:hypothetical protein